MKFAKVLLAKLAQILTTFAPVLLVLAVLSVVPLAMYYEYDAAAFVFGGTVVCIGLFLYARAVKERKHVPTPAPRPA